MFLVTSYSRKKHATWALKFNISLRGTKEEVNRAWFLSGLEFVPALLGCRMWTVWMRTVYFGPADIQTLKWVEIRQGMAKTWRPLFELTNSIQVLYFEQRWATTVEKLSDNPITDINNQQPTPDNQNHQQPPKAPPDNLQSTLGNRLLTTSDKHLPPTDTMDHQWQLTTDHQQQKFDKKQKKIHAADQVRSKNSSTGPTTLQTKVLKV